tara:strand:+ start:1766 stop:1870 length:105 start_codon:yes stop_codon:yes gene_type:complete
MGRCLISCKKGREELASLLYDKFLSPEDLNERKR